MECCFQNNRALHCTSGDAPLETHYLNLGGSGAGLPETPTDLMNADMSVTTQQCADLLLKTSTDLMNTDMSVTTWPQIKYFYVLIT